MNNYYEKKIAIIVNILSKLKAAVTVKKLIKLVYIADKVHLGNYGRTVSMDNFVAMKDGPVPSCLYDMLKTAYPHAVINKYNKTPEKVISLLHKYIDIDDKGESKEVKLTKEDSSLYNFLSQTDIKTLEKVALCFGEKEEEELIELTHDFEEWKKYEQELKQHPSSFSFSIEDMLNYPPILSGLIDKNKFEFVKESMTDDCCL